MRHIDFGAGSSSQYTINAINLARHRWTLPDGTGIEVFSNGGVDHIVINVIDTITEPQLLEEISEFFLETGYVDLRVEGLISPLFASEVDPGKLYYPEYVESALTADIPYLDEAITEDSEPRRGYTSGMDSQAFKVHADGPGEKRIAWITHRGTEWTTGKLRLAVQAQYGREDSDDDAADVAPLLAQYGEPNKQTRTYVLYSGSASEPDYWLLTITSNNVSAQRIGIPDNYTDEFYGRMEDADTEDRLKIEAYMLSAAEVDGSSLNASIDAIEGDTFAYGWKANSLGTELVMVTNEGVFDVIDNPFHYICRLYKMSISIQQDGNGAYSLTVNVVKEEETNCTPQNNVDIVWLPNLPRNWMETFNWHPSGVSEDKYINGLLAVEDAPFYAFYNANDELVVFRYYMDPDASDGLTVSEIANARATWEAAETICQSGSKSGSDNWAVDYVSSGFYVDIDGNGTAAGLDQQTGAYYVDYEFSVSETGNTTNQLPSFSPGFTESSIPGYCNSLVDDTWLDGLSRYAITVHESEFTLLRKRSNNSTVKGDSILIIPFGEDCAYLGTLTGIDGLMNYHDATRERYSHITSTITGAVNSSLFAASGDGGATGFGFGSDWVADSSLHDNSQYEQEYDVNFTLYHRHGNETAVTLHVESSHPSDQSEATTEAYFQLGSWAAWFDPPINDDNNLTPLLEVQESFGNAEDYAILYTRDPTQGDDRYAVSDDELPDDVRPLNDGIFVGWV